MRGTKEEQVYKHLFTGEKENVIKCVNLNHESKSKERFTVL